MNAAPLLVDFLRRRRELLRPGDVGLPVTSRRRTPGLRREEVAMLAGVSVDYYTRLEQGRESSPSASVAGALAGALQCDLDQRDHLFHLARLPLPPRHAGHHVRPGLLALARRLTDIPVLITSDLGEVLWCNPLGSALVGDLPARPGRDRNLVWRWFTDPTSRAMPEADWDRISAAHVSDLRAVAARRAADQEVTAFVEDLLSRSAEFRELWQRHDVATHRSDVKTLLHPEVGAVPLRCEVLLTPDEDVWLLAFFPLEGTDAAEKLELLRVIGVQELHPAGSAVHGLPGEEVPPQPPPAHQHR